jgi:hypothetical protein
VVSGGGDALNTQDNVRRDDAEHNDLSHVHNLTRSRLGRLYARYAQTQVALRDGRLPARVCPRPAEFTAGNSPRGMAKVPPCQRRPTLSAADEDARGQVAAMSRDSILVRLNAFGLVALLGYQELVMLTFS